MNSPNFEEFVALMNLKVGEKPSIHIDLEETPAWVSDYIENFCENTLRSDIGLLDILGTYNSENRKITIYREAIEYCCVRLQIDCLALEKVVLAHELAHAANHLGVDDRGKIWHAFGFAEIRVKEYFAQWYAQTMWAQKGNNPNVELMQELTRNQPSIYGTYANDTHVNISVINAKLMGERQKPEVDQWGRVVRGGQQMCGFCKIRIATEEVEPWFDCNAIGLGLMQWPTPACATCSSIEASKRENPLL